MEMELVEICYEGSESYPTDPPPDKPPPQKRILSQQERLQVIIALIIENQNGRGARIEKVVSEAVGRGIVREQVLNDIQHLKFEGYVYEPKNGEIKYAL